MVAALPFALFGIANALVLIAVDTYLQQVVPTGMRGRVFSTRFTLTQGTYAVSVLVGGALAGVVDVRVLFVVAGAIVAGPPWSACCPERSATPEVGAAPPDPVEIAPGGACRRRDSLAVGFLG